MQDRKEKVLKCLYSLSKHKNSCIIKENVIDLNTYAEWKFRQEHRDKNTTNKVTATFVVKDICNEEGQGILILYANGRRYKVPIQARQTALFKLGDKLHLTLKNNVLFREYTIIDFYSFIPVP